MTSKAKKVNNKKRKRTEKNKKLKDTNPLIHISNQSFKEN